MVKLPRKNKWNKPFSEKIARRVSKIPTFDLLNWADQSLYELGRLLGIYQRTNTKEALKELVIGAEAFHAVIEEINKRSTHD
jgi:hypothetical protein